LFDIEDCFMNSLARRIFHAFCTREYRPPTRDASFQRGFSETKDFFLRLENRIDLDGKTVIDIGCGLGQLASMWHKKEQEKYLE